MILIDKLNKLYKYNASNKAVNFSFKIRFSKLYFFLFNFVVMVVS